MPPLGRRALCAALGLPQSAAAAYSPPPHRELPPPPALCSPLASPSPAVPVPAGLRGEHARCLLTHSHRLRSRQKGLHVDLANGGATAAAAVSALKVDTRAKRVGLNLVIDSGCTFHMHGHKADLINQRRCSDTVGGIDGIVHHCTTIGDLPVFARATSGKIYRLLLQDVRHFEGVPYSLVSVKQLWTSGGVDSVFRDVECMIVPTSAGTISFPFTHRGGVYQWHVDGCASEAKARRDQGLVLKANAKPPPPPPPLPARLRVATADPQATTGAIHRAKASAHLDALGSNTVAAILHRRLHAGLDRLRKLATTTADAPLGIAAASGLNRGPHVEANAVRASHTGKGYTPSYPGRLVHADILGPLTPSKNGRYRYVLVLVDDDSRLKAAYPLHSASPTHRSASASSSPHSTRCSTSTRIALATVSARCTRTTPVSSSPQSSPSSSTRSPSLRPPVRLTCTTSTAWPSAPSALSWR